MTQLIGDPSELKTRGEQRVWETLKALPDEWIGYLQPKIVDDEGREHHPDFVLIHPQHGLVVLEVKDRQSIKKVQGESLLVVRQDGTKVWETPLSQVRNHTFALVNRLQADPLFQNAKGKLDFPYRYGVVFPNQARHIIEKIRELWGRYVFGGEDFEPTTFFETQMLEIPIPPRRWKSLTQEQINTIRALLKPELILRDEQGRVKGVLDLTQERVAEEPLPQPNWEARAERIETFFPEEVRETITAPHVRLVRGYAGTGKTDVLLLRARYLAARHSEKHVLVTSFNKPLVEERLRPALKPLQPTVKVRRFGQICRALYEQAYPDRDPSPQSPEGVFSGPLPKEPNIAPLLNKYGRDFLVAEIQWIKENRIWRLRDYLRVKRRGRGGEDGRRLSRLQREEVWRVYEAYEKELKRLRALDWNDLYNTALELVEEGRAIPNQYDAILVDEAQHFAPTWIELLKQHLKPGGHLFLCDDPTQGIYRYYSWRERGVEVRGRTRWLRIPYRTTRQVARALFALLESNPELQHFLQDTDEFQPVDLDHPALRDGELPEILLFDTWQAEKSRIVQYVAAWVEQEGLLPQEIAVLHPEAYVLNDLMSKLPSKVHCHSPKDQTGMEYRAVLLPRIEGFFKRDTKVPFSESRLRNLQTFFVAASRARDWLVITGKNLPNQIKPLVPYVTLKEENL